MGQQANLGGCRPMQVVKALEKDLKIGFKFKFEFEPFPNSNFTQINSK
jgi:hypothetical protein